MQKIRLLIIDDNEGLVSIIKDYFKNNNEIEVVLTATDGEEGIKIVGNNEGYDMILLDLILPKRDGITILEYMKDKHIVKPVIVFSSYNAPCAIQRVSELGASYYLLKPFDFSYLEQKIKNIMNRKVVDNKAIDLFSNNLQIFISNTLHELGVPSHVNGYKYIKEAISIMCIESSMESYMTKELYLEIAKRHNSTSTRVERSIRHAIEISWNRGNWELIDKLFGNSVDIDRAKPTNSEFIVTIEDMMKLEMKQSFSY